MTGRVDPADVDPGLPSWQTLYERARDRVNTLMPEYERLREANIKAGVDLGAAYLRIRQLEDQVAMLEVQVARARRHGFR